MPRKVAVCGVAMMVGKWWCYERPGNNVGGGKKRDEERERERKKRK